MARVLSCPIRPRPVQQPSKPIKQAHGIDDDATDDIGDVEGRIACRNALRSRCRLLRKRIKALWRPLQKYVGAI